MFVGNPTAFLCFSALGMPAVPAFCDHGPRSRLPLLESHAAWQSHCLTSRFIQFFTSYLWSLQLNKKSRNLDTFLYPYVQFCSYSHVLNARSVVYNKREAHLHPAAWRLARPGLGQAFPRAEAPLWATACSLGRQNVPLLRSRAQ